MLLKLQLICTKLEVCTYGAQRKLQPSFSNFLSVEHDLFRAMRCLFLLLIIAAFTEGSVAYFLFAICLLVVAPVGWALRTQIEGSF